MFTPREFRDLISGRRRDLAARLWRVALRIAGNSLRRWKFRGAIGVSIAASTPIHRVSVPVVSVGNLTLGGTGKTPLVEWIARWFRKRNVRVSIVSRGYGAEDGEPQR